MGIRRARVSCVLLALALVAAACGGDDDDAASNDDTSGGASGEAPAGSGDDVALDQFPESVRIVAGGAAESFSDGVILETKRLVREDGVEIEESILEDTSAAVRTIVGGNADIFFGDPILALLAVQNGDAPIKYLASSVQGTDYVLLATPEWDIDDLSGAVVGSAGPGTSGTVIGDAALTKLGVDTGELEYLEVGGTSARVTAILNGQIDIAAAHAADAIPPLAQGDLQVLLNTGEVLGPYLQQGLIVREDFIEEYPEFVQQFVDHLIAASRTAAGGYDAYRVILDEAGIDTGLTAEEEAEVYDQFVAADVFAVNGGVCDDIIDVTLEYNVDAGTVDEGELIDQDDWVDTSFVDNSLADEGGLTC